MTKSFLFLTFFSAALGLALPVCAASISPLDDPAIPGGDRYDRCLALSRTRPQESLAAANAWRTAGGGDAAAHCAAVSLVALRRYSEAGSALDVLARDSKSSAAVRAQLYDQAGNAWLLARQANNAEASFSSALTLSPSDPEILTDRARARAMLQNWAGADADLSAALAIAPLRADILVLRSSARHAEGRAADAKADVDRALQIRPGYPEALVERGDLKYESGDTAGAQADWQQVVNDSPSSDAAVSARDHLQQLQRQQPVTPPVSAGH